MTGQFNNTCATISVPPDVGPQPGDDLLDDPNVSDSGSGDGDDLVDDGGDLAFQVAPDAIDEGDLQDLLLRQPLLLKEPLLLQPLLLGNPLKPLLLGQPLLLPLLLELESPVKCSFS